MTMTMQHMAQFVGRRPEVAEIRAAIDEAVAGQGGLVLITGEAGIGKTRLAQEACERAIAAGASVVWGRCLELEGTPAYWPWIQVLRGTVQDVDRASLARELGEVAGEISRVVPEFGSGRPLDRYSPLEDGDRFRLFDAVARLLQWVTATRSLVIVLDDLQWCDAPSLALIRHLSRDLHDSSVLVIASYRDGEIGRRHPLAAMLPELSRERGARRLRLKGLGVGEVSHYLLTACNAAVDASVAAAIHEQTGGNPFFVAELGRLLLEEGELRRGALPHGVREVIGRRLDLLSDECNRLLAAASVLGRDFELEVLCETAHLPVSMVLELMDEAERAALVVPRRESPGRYSFVHDLVRETVYQELSTPIRVQLHHGAAESLERRTDGGRLPALAHHWFEAAPDGSWEKAVLFASRAADQAMEQLAYEEAARLRQMALDALSDRPRHELRRWELLVQLADARYRSGDLALSVRSCLAAAQIGRELRRPDLQARAALVVQNVADAELQLSLEQLCEDALEAVGDRDDALRARLLAHLASVLDTAGRPERNDALSREAVDLAERSQDAEALVSAIYARHTTTTGPEGVEERLALGTRLLEIAGRSTRTAHAAWGRLWRIDALFQQGELASVSDELAELEGVVDRLGQPLFRWQLLRTRAALAYATGRFPEAQRLTEQARGAGRADQHRMTEILYRTVMAEIALAVGSSVPMHEAIPALEAVPPALRPGFLAVVMRLEVALGREESARVRFEELINVSPRLTPARASLMITASLAEAAVVLGSSEETAAALYQALAPYRRSFVTMGAGATVCLGSAARFQGMLAASLQRWEDAERDLEEAVRQNTQAGALPFAAYAEIALAEVLARWREKRHALERARSAGRTAARLGMRPLEERAGRLVAELRRASPRLSPRETEVAAMVARGLSNRAIGESLHLSERTAENHVKHILDKLGFTSRTQIAAWAVAEGLLARREIEYRG
jgi:DNA-binding CsgD family transcriptional regulator/tetratricopeptide (TPR) repeat protein